MIEVALIAGRLHHEPHPRRHETLRALR
jgi:hypothetical protein